MIFKIIILIPSSLFSLQAPSSGPFEGESQSFCDPENGPQRAQLCCTLAKPLGRGEGPFRPNLWRGTNEGHLTEVAEGVWHVMKQVCWMPGALIAPVEILQRVDI